MQHWITILGAVVAVFGVAVVGALLRRANRLTADTDRTLMDLTVRLFWPCLILETTLGNERLSDPRNLVWPPLVGAACLLLGFAVAATTLRIVRPLAGLHTPTQRRTFILAVGVFNYAYLPVPLARLLFDPGTLGVLFVHNLGTELAMWTVGVLIVTGRMGRSWWRGALNPPSLALIAALILNAFGLARFIPPFAWSMLRMLGDCAVPVAVLLVGATVADELSDGSFHWGAGVIGAAAFLRLGLLPVLFAAGALVLPVSIELKRVMILQGAMPAAMFPIVMSRYYDGDPPTAVRVVLGTSLLALVTIPIWLSIGLPLLER